MKVSHTMVLDATRTTTKRTATYDASNCCRGRKPGTWRTNTALLRPCLQHRRRWSSGRSHRRIGLLRSLQEHWNDREGRRSTPDQFHGGDCRRRRRSAVQLSEATANRGVATLSGDRGATTRPRRWMLLHPAKLSAAALHRSLWISLTNRSTQPGAVRLKAIPTSPKPGTVAFSLDGCTATGIYHAFIPAQLTTTASIGAMKVSHSRTESD